MSRLLRPCTGIMQCLGSLKRGRMPPDHRPLSCDPYDLPDIESAGETGGIYFLFLSRVNLRNSGSLVNMLDHKKYYKSVPLQILFKFDPSKQQYIYT